MRCTTRHGWLPVPRVRATIKVVDNVDVQDRDESIAEIQEAVDDFFEDESVESVTITVDEWVNGEWVRIAKKSRAR